jgi:hypothetical protein
LFSHCATVCGISNLLLSVGLETFQRVEGVLGWAFDMRNTAKKVVKFTVAIHNSADHIKRDEMGRKCGTYGGE